MKPYGKKQESSKFPYKCKHDTCGICSSSGWKIYKSRERCIEYEETPNTPPDWHEIDHLVRLERYVYGDKEWFTATYNPLDICADGVTEDHAFYKLSEKYAKLVEEKYGE